MGGSMVDGWVDGQTERGGSIHVKLSIPKQKVLNIEANQSAKEQTKP